MSGLEWNREFALEQTAGDQELLDELMGLFIDSSADNLADLKQGVDAGDPAVVIAAAHSLKGSAASLGLESVRQLAFDMEMDARKGSVACAREKLADLEEQLAMIRKM